MSDIEDTFHFGGNFLSKRGHYSVWVIRTSVCWRGTYIVEGRRRGIVSLVFWTYRTEAVESHFIPETWEEEWNYLTMNSNVSIWDASSTTRRSTGSKSNTPISSKAGFESMLSVHRITRLPLNRRSKVTESLKRSSDRTRCFCRRAYRSSCLRKLSEVCEISGITPYHSR